MKIKKLGRAFEYKNGIGLSYSASGIEFEAVDGFKCELSSDRWDMLEVPEIHQPRFVLFCDGVQLIDDRMPEPRMNLLFGNCGKHVYRLIKVSESADSTVFVSNLRSCGTDSGMESDISQTDRRSSNMPNGAMTDSQSSNMPNSAMTDNQSSDMSESATAGGSGCGCIKKNATEPAKRLRIEFIGDSITCGYGVEGKLSPDDHYTTATENCLKAYAWLCAEKLSADCTLVSKSGAGIISGYTPDGVRNTGNLLAPVYDRAGCSEGKTDDGGSVEDIAWNGGEEPDIVVVNLGTNDVSYCFPGGGFNAENISDEEKRAVCYDGEGILTKTQQEKINEIRCSFFYNEYRKFLKAIRNRYENAEIICTLGIMNSELNGTVKRAANDSCAELGKVHFFEFSLYDAENDGLGTDYHPSAISQEKAAKELAAYINHASK